MIKIAFVGLLSIIAGCYVPITGHIIDAETQQPIEGAVVLVEWTKTHGYGDHWTESYKVVEAVSDNDGKVKLEGCFCPFTNPPDVTVYKKGYVAWNNKYIFPRYTTRKDFNWQYGFVHKMESFKKEYSYRDHVLFIHGCINYGLPENTKRSIEDAIDWEADLARQELKNK